MEWRLRRVVPAARQSAATSMAGFLVNCSSTKGDIYVPGTAVRIPKFYVPDRVIFRYPYSSTSIFLRRVVPAAAVTTHAKPHAQRQLARDLEVERAAMGQRCRPQSFGEVQRGNPQQRRLVTFLTIFFICWKG